MDGLYIHIPFCRSKCYYCDFASKSGMEDRIDAYIEAVCGEAAGCGCLSAFYPRTVYIGGGTPSLLEAHQLRRLVEGISKSIDLSGVSEFTMEANPGTLTRDKLLAYKIAGVNRLSMGLQAAQDSILRSIGRIHSAEDFMQSFRLARQCGYDNINADMMTGLPGQSVRDALETAQILCALGAEHISCYALRVEEGTPLRSMLRSKRLTIPDDDSERDMFHEVERCLTGEGYVRYEISNFALPGKESQHNLNYWQRGRYLGLGVAAASYYNDTRPVNTEDTEEYIARIRSGQSAVAQSERVDAEAREFEDIMLSLRLAQGLDIARFNAEHSANLLVKYAGAIEKNVAGALMRVDGGRVFLTEKGFDLQNAVLLDFMC